MAPALRLDEVVPWGRSLDEYVGMFDLGPADLAGRILDCGGGPASFAAEAAAAGQRVVACDPIYQFTGPEIRRRVDEIAPILIADMVEDADSYVWDRFADAADVGRHRLMAMQRFLDDFEVGRAAGRYVTAALPSLPFADQAFDLTLSSHLLFLYSTQLSRDFHVAAVVELMRVAAEVRVFPLIDLEGDRSPHVAPVIEAVRGLGAAMEIVQVPYEFRRGANEMLRIRRPTTAKP